MPNKLPNIRVPAGFESTMSWLATQDEDVIDAAGKVLGSGTYDRVDVINTLGRTPGWSQDRAADAVHVLESLSDVQRLFGVTPQELARSVVRDRDDAGVLEARISALLGSDAIQLISRGRELANEREHVLADARILTDVRPLFTQGSTENLDGAIITHSLRLRYTGAAEPTLHIALDRAHLQLLAGLVERALRKAAHLQEQLSRLGLPYVEPGGDVEEVQILGEEEL